MNGPIRGRRAPSKSFSSATPPKGLAVESQHEAGTQGQRFMVARTRRVLFIGCSKEQLA